MKAYMSCKLGYIVLTPIGLVVSVNVNVDSSSQGKICRYACMAIYYLQLLSSQHFTMLYNMLLLRCT